MHIQLEQFSTSAALLGATITLGGNDLTGLNTLKSLVNSLTASGQTNYADALTVGQNYENTVNTGASNTINTTFFVSDGEPNYLWR